MLLNKLTSIMKEKLVDAIIVSDKYNMRYLSGFRGASGYLYITEDRQVLLTDSRYTIQAQEEAPDYEVLTISSQRGYGKNLRQLMEADHIQCAGFENLQLIYEDYRTLKNSCPDEVTWVSLNDSLNRLRMVKTEEELRYMEQAQAIGDAAFSHILGQLKPGMTELQVAAEIEYFMKGKGAYGTSFDTIAASGIHSAMPHAMPSEKKIEKGDFLTMDFGCIFQDYCSDMTRTVVIGKADEKQKEIYRTVRTAQQAALDIIRAGLTGSEVDKAARDIITEAGYGEYFGHGLGHSVGLYIHEEPRLSPNSEEVLLENVIQTVEPGIYLPGFGGVRIEDMVIVKENGCINLTHSAKELIEL